MRGLVIRQREGGREARQSVVIHHRRSFGKIWNAIERDTRNYDDGEQNGIE